MIQIRRHFEFTGSRLFREGKRARWKKIIIKNLNREHPIFIQILRKL